MTETNLIAGLLGARIEHPHSDNHAVIAARLYEIERRILLIEEAARQAIS